MRNHGKPIVPQRWKMKWNVDIKPSWSIIVFHCFLFLGGGVVSECWAVSSSPCSGLKLWIVLKEAQTTEEKSKEASVGSWWNMGSLIQKKRQYTDVPQVFRTWLEHLLGFMVIHRGGSSPGLIPFMPLALGNMLNGRTHRWSGAAGKRSCRWCNPELIWTHALEKLLCYPAAFCYPFALLPCLDGGKGAYSSCKDHFSGGCWQVRENLNPKRFR